MPDLDFAPQSHHKVSARRRERERCDLRPEGEVVDGHAAGNVGQNRMAVFVNGEKEVSAWGEADSNNVLAMGEW